MPEGLLNSMLIKNFTVLSKILHKSPLGILARIVLVTILGTSILFSSSSVSLASEEDTITGIWNGSTVVIPVELSKGDRIIGDMLIAEDSMYARIISPSGEIVIEETNVTSIHVDYVAEISGTISFAIMWLFGSGNPTYSVTYTIYPLGSSQPPVITTTPPPATTPPSDSTNPPIWIWLTSGFIVLGIFIAFAVTRYKVGHKKYHDKDKDGEDMVFMEGSPKQCKRCKGTGKILRGTMPVQRGGSTEMKEVYYGCLICGGTGWDFESDN